MLNTPPDFKVAEVRNDCELESCSSCGYCEQYKQPELCDEKVDGQQAIVEVAKLAVEVKKLEATATVEVERLRQHGVTARVRISEENKTQRSACVAALVKRVVEEHHQTEREKIAATAETQQASIAAEVKKAELEAQRPKPVPEYFLLLLLYFQRHRRKMARVGVFLLLLKAFWTFSGSNSSISGRWSELWRGIIRLLQRRNLLGDGLFVGQQHRCRAYFSKHAAASATYCILLPWDSFFAGPQCCNPSTTIDPFEMLIHCPWFISKWIATNVRYRPNSKLPVGGKIWEVYHSIWI